MNLTVKSRCYFQQNVTSVIIIDPSTPCGGIVSSPTSTYTIYYWLDFICTSSCNEPIRVLCDSLSEFTLSCDYNVNALGFYTYENSISRETYGSINSDCIEQVTPFCEGCSRDTFMAGDNLKLFFNGSVIGGNFDTSFIQVNIGGVTTNSLLIFDSLLIEFWDDGAQNAFQCSLYQPDSEFIENGERHLIFSLENLLQQGECFENLHITDGDNFQINAFFNVSFDTPNSYTTIPLLKGGFSFNHEGIHYSCGGQSGGSIIVFNPDCEINFDYDYLGDGCDTIKIHHEIVHGYKHRR